MKARQIENEDYLAMCSRLLRAAGRRVSDSDPDTLALFIRLRDTLDQEICLAASSLNQQGFSWGEIGKSLSISRAAAHKRFSNK